MTIRAYRPRKSDRSGGPTAAARHLTQDGTVNGNGVFPEELGGGELYALGDEAIAYAWLG
jgi:hypothetical protein